MADKINADKLNETIQASLERYEETVVKGLKKSTKDAMKTLVDNTKATAPVGKRDEHYRDNISSKTLSETNDGITKLWYVKGSDYRLSHLLNNGHALRDGSRYPGTNFIGKAVDQLIPWYLAQVEEVLKNK